MKLCGSLNIFWHSLSLGVGWKLTFSSYRGVEVYLYAGVCSYRGIFIVCWWICLTHSKCSINNFRIIYLYFNRMCACLWHKQWPGKNDIRRGWLSMAGLCWYITQLHVDSEWWLLSYFHPSWSVYVLASQVVLLGFYLAGLCPSLSSRQEEKQPGLSLPVSGGAGTVTREAQERPRFQEAFLEGFFRSRVSMADVTPAIFRSSGSGVHCLNREF